MPDCFDTFSVDGAYLIETLVSDAGESKRRFQTTKFSFRAAAVFGLIAAFQPVLAMAAPAATFQIPFDFMVGDKTFPAGNYRVTEPDKYSMKVQGVDYGESKTVLTFSSERRRSSGEVTLTFTRYGEKYFLSQLSDYDHGSVVPVKATRGSRSMVRLLWRRRGEANPLLDQDAGL